MVPGTIYSIYIIFVKEKCIMKRLLEILEDLHPEVDFENHDRLIDDRVLDSFDIITLISDINEEFDVIIPVEHILPENFNSARLIYQLIEDLLNEDY